MSGRGSKRLEPEGSTPVQNEKQMCQEAARDQQGNTTPWDPLRQDVSRLWSNGGKGIFALIDVLEKHMKDKCGEVHSAITAGDHERLQQARSKARGMVVDACSQFSDHVEDGNGLVISPLPLGVDEECRAMQNKCKTVISSIVLRLPKFQVDEIEQVTRTLGRLLVR